MKLVFTEAFISLSQEIDVPGLSIDKVLQIKKLFFDTYGYLEDILEQNPFPKIREDTIKQNIRTEQSVPMFEDDLPLLETCARRLESRQDIQTEEDELVNPNPPELDAVNRTWDTRIHSRTKSLVRATGHWRMKRGVSPKLIKEVNKELDEYAELRSAGKVPLPPIIKDPEVIAEVIIPQIPKNNKIPPAPPSEEIKPKVPDVTFTSVMKLITSVINSEELTKERILQMLNELGESELTGLIQNPDKQALLKIKIEKALWDAGV